MNDNLPPELLPYQTELLVAQYFFDQARQNATSVEFAERLRDRAEEIYDRIERSLAEKGDNDE